MPSVTKGVDNSISQDASIWINSVNQILIGLAKNFKLDAITHLVLDATSYTVLLTDQEGRLLSKARDNNVAQ